MFKLVTPYIKIVRPVNVGITGCAVALGIWLTLPAAAYPLLAAQMAMAAAMAAAAYGNVINDILDIKSDRVSHPNRPLANGSMTAHTAAILAIMLIITSLLCAWAASTFHLAAAAVPIILLTLYSIYFKRTRITGNIIVASLVAYALMFGALPRPETKILIAPAILAFLLNFCRELVKDVQDAAGDKAAGWRTSAELPAGTIKGLLAGAAGIYAVIMLIPSVVLGDFGTVYTIICLIAIIPLHIYWVTLMFRGGVKKYAKKIGAALKLEMVAGLLAMGMDRIFSLLSHKILPFF
ncbi:MAG: UbiA family prenyltransferase [Chitinispirillales bacterium]|jgi:4-hydroxybenzoate polyprenyltransferase|nr:UbiA family prenyltransferase [Chitinispirillales bacterium]